MTNYNIWPIFTEESSSLFIKHRKVWLLSSSSTYIYILLILFLLFYIFWYISKNIEIYPYMDISLLDKISTRQIYLYVLNMNKDILTLKSFWYNYNFLHFYLNLIIKDPLIIIKGYLYLFIFRDNILFDNALLHFFLDLNLLYYPNYYWSIVLSKKWSLYYFKELFALPAWPRLPRFWWYWTDYFYVFNYNSTLLKWFPKEDHRMILIMEALRPYIYSLFVYFSYLYWYNYNEYFVNLTEPGAFIDWGYFWGTSQLGKLMKWFHLNRNSIIMATKPVSIAKLDYLEIFANIQKESYLLQTSYLFFPRITTFFFAKLYLPVYLPVESFNLWIKIGYDNLLWIFSSSFIFNQHFLSVSEFSSLSYIIKEYIKHYFYLTHVNYMLEYYLNIYHSFVTHSKYYYSSNIEEFFNWEYIMRQVNLEIYRLKRMQKLEFYGVWSVKNLKPIFLFIFPYIWTFWALFSLWKSYFYTDTWLINIVWYNPTYLWHLFEVNQDIEHDYMLSVEYLRESRIKDYPDMYYNILRALYWITGIYVMNYVLLNLESGLGFAYYFAYCFQYSLNDHFYILICSWILYVIIPVILGSLYFVFVKTIYALKKIPHLLYLNYWFLLLINMPIFNLFERNRYFHINKKIYNLQTNYFILNKQLSAHPESSIDIKTYWYSGQKICFDLINVKYSMHNNGLSTQNYSNKLQANLINNSKLHMQFYNFSWLVIQTNHFYKYYDYIDDSRYSMKKLSDF